MESNGELYYVDDSGDFHRVAEIIDFEDSIMAEDEALFEDKDDPGTIRTLKRDMHFERSLTIESKENLDAVSQNIDLLFERHVELYDLMWIAELAKRYLEEKYECIHV